VVCLGSGNDNSVQRTRIRVVERGLCSTCQMKEARDVESVFTIIEMLPCDPLGAKVEAGLATTREGSERDRREAVGRYWVRIRMSRSKVGPG